MKVTCNIDKKYFADKDGVEHRYYDYSMVLDGQVVTLVPRKDNKKLCNYVLDKVYQEDKK